MSTIGRQIYIYIYIQHFILFLKDLLGRPVSVDSLTSRCSRNERVTPSRRTKTGPKRTEARDRAASFRVGGAKEECVKENFGGGPGGGGMLVDFYSIYLK